MKCPNCGADIPDKYLYCEKCGEEIHIVPEFDAEVESDVQQTIQKIADEIFLKEDKEHREKKDGAVKGKNVWRVVRTVLMLLLVVLIAIFAIEVTRLNRYNSFDYQLESASNYETAGQYREAIGCYLRALELDRDNIPVKFSLSELYYNLDNKYEYERLLLEIIHSPNASTDELNSAYGQLIAIYRSDNDYEAIKQILLDSNNENIISSYQDYIADPPQFSAHEGYYTEAIPLKLFSEVSGEILYTLNGDDPVTAGIPYSMPIVLDDGDHTVKAVFVNELGINSEVITEEYHIKIEEAIEPEIGAVSGNYEFPILIEVLEDDEDIYYTTDETDPTVNSIKYVRPIPMPLGKSVFKFVRIRDGEAGAVAVRTYELTMHTEYTPEDAIADVFAYQAECGRNVSPENPAENSYDYRYQYVTNINRIDDFYVIAEYMRQEDGSFASTNQFYAVNAYNRQIYQLYIQNGNNYTLVEIQRETQNEG